MSFKILTESTVNLSNEDILKNDIKIVSLFYYVNDKEYMSYDGKTSADLVYYYEQIEKRAPVRTSCANEQIYYEAFEECLKAGNDVLYLGLSSGVSASFNAGMLAINRIKEQYPDRKIIAVDTLSASLGQALMVLEACKLKEEGKSIEEVAEVVEKLKYQVLHYIAVDDLYNMYKGGRIPKLLYTVSSVMKLKPILTVSNEGAMMSYAKVLTRKKSLIDLAKIVCEKMINPENETLYISHAHCIEEVNSLIEKIKAKINIKKIVIEMMEPVVGCHGGYRTIATFFKGAKR